MKKLFNKLKHNTLFGIIIGILITSSTGVLALNYIYNSDQVSYSDKNVKESLDELYDKIKLGTATSEDIVSGKNALVKGELVEGSGMIGVPILGISTVNDYDDNNYNRTTIIYDTTKVKKIVIDDMMCQYNILNSVYIMGSKDNGSTWTTLKVINSAKNVSNYTAHEYDVEIDISEYNRLKFYIRIASVQATYGFGYSGIHFY